MNRNVATGPGTHTPDGCAVELYKRLRDEGEARIIHSAINAGDEILELGAGAGRVTHELIALGHPVTAVDFSTEMLAEIRGARTICADIAGLDLATPFPCVVLGSYLINVIETELRHAFLAACARHVSANGVVLIDAHEPSVLDRAKPGRIGVDTSGFTHSWLQVETTGNVISGTLESRNEKNVWTQRFSAEILDRPSLEAELERAGLRFARSLERGWIQAKRFEGHTFRETTWKTVAK